MGRFLLFWGMQPAARIIYPPWRAANAAGGAVLFAAVRRMLCDRFLRKAPRVERSAALSYFLMSRTILPQARQRWAMGR